MKKKLKLFLYKLSMEISKEIKKETEVDFDIYSDGKKIKTISISHLPSVGHIIYKTDALFKSDNYKFQIESIELSETGFTGKLHGRIIK